MESISLLGNEAIDRDATRKKVESVLETARIYSQMGLVVRKGSRTTSSYEPKRTNAIGKVTEQVAVYNVESEERLKLL